jgi:hypothetical protein
MKLENHFYTVTEVADVLNLSVRTIQRKCSAQGVDKLNGNYIIPQSLLKQWKNQIWEAESKLGYLLSPKQMQQIMRWANKSIPLFEEIYSIETAKYKQTKYNKGFMLGRKGMCFEILDSTYPIKTDDEDHISEMTDGMYEFWKSNNRKLI